LATAKSEQKRRWSSAISSAPEIVVFLLFSKDRATRDSFYRESRIKRNSVRKGYLRSITRGDVLDDSLAGQGWNTLAGRHLYLLMIHSLEQKVKFVGQKFTAIGFLLH
jgi:hypothetical protein